MGHCAECTYFDHTAPPPATMPGVSPKSRRCLRDRLDSSYPEFRNPSDSCDVFKKRPGVDEEYSAKIANLGEDIHDMMEVMKRRKTDPNQIEILDFAFKALQIEYAELKASMQPQFRTTRKAG